MAGSRPRVILSAAMSIDGKIATRTNDSGFSSDQDIRRLHRLRSDVDAILVGSNTISRDDPLLTVRHARGRNPVRIVLDSKGTIPGTSKILQTCDHIPTIVAVSKGIARKNLERLKRLPVDVIRTGTDTVSLRSLLRMLSERGIRTVLVEGGGTVNWEFVRQDLFDEMILTLSPFLIGGGGSVPYLRGAGFGSITDSPGLRLKSAKRLKNHLILHYVKL